MSFTKKLICKVLLIQFLCLFQGYLAYSQDSDTDGIADASDLDDDNDGIPDTQEILKLTGYQPLCGAAVKPDFSATPSLLRGTAKMVGAVYRISNVLSGTDALVEIEARQNISDLVLDDNSSQPASFKPSTTTVNMPLNGEAYVQYKITFVASGTENPVILGSMFANIADNDGNAGHGEFAYFTDHVAYTHLQTINMTVVNPVNDANEPWTKVVSGTYDATGTDTTDKSVAVSVKYANFSSLRMRFGIVARQTNAGNLTRGHRADFGCILKYATPETNVIDFDEDGVINILDRDSDNDGIADVKEAGGNDTDNNGYIGTGEGTAIADANSNGLANLVDAANGGTALVLTNSDSDVNPDFLDTDSDGDGIADIIESQSTSAFAGLSGQDTDNDGIDNTFDTGFKPVVNSDGGDLPDYLDLNSDNDTHTDAIEGWDTDNNGTANITAAGADTDKDGLDDAFDADDTKIVAANGQTPASFPNSDKVATEERDWREVYVSVPVANPDILAATEDTPLTLNNVILNDLTSDDGPSLTSPFSVTKQPVNGTFSISNNGTPDNLLDDIYTYTPSVNFSGNDSFIYSICDVNNECDTALVRITIAPVNDKPVVDREVVTLDEDGSATGDLTNAGDLDVENTDLTAKVIPLAAPKHGAIEIKADGSFTYTPAADFNGKDTIVTQVCDAGTPLPVQCSSDTIFVTVNPVNDKPVADNETIAINEDSPASGDITDAGDADPDGTALTVSKVLVNPKKGKFTFDANGTFSYNPDKDFNGKDTVMVEVCDSGNPLPAQCVSNAVYITVTPVNDNPVANNDASMTNPSQLVEVNVAANDTDVDDNSFTFSVISKPEGTTAEFGANGILKYTPTGSGTPRTDEVRYKITDMSGASAEAVVMITVPSVPVPPVPADDQAVTEEDNTVSEDVTANDLDPNVNLDKTTVVIIVNPKHGTASVDKPTGVITYNPAKDFSGKDTLVYRICDLTDSCASAKVVFTVTPVNDKPEANDDLTAADPDFEISFNVGENDTDVDAGTQFKFKLIYNTPGTQASLDENTGILKFKPSPDPTQRQDTVKYEISDQGNPELKDQAVVLITVPNVPVKPTPADDFLSVNEDAGGTVKVIANDRDINGNLDPGSVKLVGNPKKGNATVNASTGEISYSPQKDFNGKDTLSYEISDLGGLKNTAKVFITVNPVNDKPVAADDEAAVNPGTEVTINAGTNDNDIDAGTVFSFYLIKPSQSSDLNIGLSTGIIKYTPSQDPTIRKDTITYRVCDNGAPVMCDTAVVLVTVPYPPVPPVAVNDAVTIAEDNQSEITVTGNDTDMNNNIDKATVVVITVPKHGTATVNTSNGSVLYHPAVNYSGLDSLEYRICDLTSKCDTAKVVITVNAVNDRPVIANESITTAEETKVSGKLIGSGDSDPEGTILEVSKVVQTSSHGEFTVNNDGTFNYTPVKDYNGSDMIVAEVCDKGLPLPGVCTNDTIFVTVTPVNDKPVVLGGKFGADPGEKITIQLSSFASDVDPGSKLKYSAESRSDAGALVGLNEQTGDLYYTPSSNSAIRTDFINYKVCDNAVPEACATAQMLIDVPNRSFRPKDDITIVSEDMSVTVAVLDNDTAFNAVDTSSLVVSAGPSHGIAIVEAGKLIYTPSLNYYGQDTIAYTVCKAGVSGECKSASVSVVVLPVNDLDVVSDEYIAAIGLPAVKGNFIANDTDPENTGILAEEFVVRGPRYGTLNFSANGDFEYLPDENAYSLTDTVVFKVCDNGIGVGGGICKNDTIFFIIRQNLFVSDGFTPNGDGVNDFFIVETIIPGTIDLQVFNRWGARVYENENYRNDWDGKSNQGLTIGESLPEGTYYYEIKFANGEVRRNHITLLK
jgi:gliding motility-associated-like protein